MVCSNPSSRWWILSATLAVAFALSDTVPAQQQVVPGTNVNMVSGTTYPDGDPFLQRQNEPSSAVSTRNPLHILSGANDYRTVDIPFPSGSLYDILRPQRMNADAWVGLFKSLDGGQTWKSTLLPGYPQDETADGAASPLKVDAAGGVRRPLHAATDAVVRAGTNGMFYYAGLAFDRGDGQPSKIFVARYIDLNNVEAGDPIAYLNTRIVDSDNGARFLDKPALATDVPRTAARCTFTATAPGADPVAQDIPAGNVYVAYTAFTGTGPNEQSQILFSRSTTCGQTWDAQPRVLSTGSRLVQNAQIAVSPATGHVYVSWRRFRYLTQDDAVMVVRSIDGGQTFSKPVRVAGLRPFDQPSTPYLFRSNGFQTMAIDGAGRVYLAWSERGHATQRSDPTTGDARVVLSTSLNGSTWSVPRPIQRDGLGHQVMPAITFHAGKLRILYYDLREDVSGLFGDFVDEFPILSGAAPPIRHTMDVYLAQALPGAAPAFTAARLSDYAHGFLPGSEQFEQLQFNPPNLPLFKQGTTPFMGDYIDLAPSPAFVQNADGSWAHNVAATGSAMSHAFWTDNRDVRPPPVERDWSQYAPVRSPALRVDGQSRFDPSLRVPDCDPSTAGMRNQNIYTARVTEGLFVSAPGNNKPLGSLQRAFVVVAENATGLDRTFRLTIDNQPPGGTASFLQFEPLLTVEVPVPAFSSLARTVFVTSTDERARVAVSIVELAPTPGGLTGQVLLNPDPATPRLQNPRLQNPDFPDIYVAESYDPAVTSSVVGNPRLQNPRLQNPRLQNPRLQNPTILNPRLQNEGTANPRLQNDAIVNPGVVNTTLGNVTVDNSAIENPRLQNPRLQNPRLQNAGFTDTSWDISNDGNTTAAYTVNLVMTNPLPAGFVSQLFVHKTTMTPAALGCELAEQPHTVLIANVTDPIFETPNNPGEYANPRLQNPRLQNPTLALGPGESATITVRVFDPDRTDGVTFDAGASIVPATVAHSVNTEDIRPPGEPQPPPPIAIPLTVTTPVIPPTAPGSPLNVALANFGASGAVTCAVIDGQIPPGVSLVNGTIVGTPTTPGNYRFTIRCTDAEGRSDDQTLNIQVNPETPQGFDRLWNGIDTDWGNPANWSPLGVPGVADRVYISASSVPPQLMEDVTVEDLFLEPGATIDTNGFTLTVTRNADAGRTIVGAGRVVLTANGGLATGVFNNLEIAGRVALVGPLTATGNLTLRPGARLDLGGHPLTVGGQLVTNVTNGALPVIAGPAATFITAGVDVNGLVLQNAPLTVNQGALTSFSNVLLLDFAPQAVQLTFNHAGVVEPFDMHGLSFSTEPSPDAGGELIHATDVAPGGQPLVMNVVGGVPFDGSDFTGLTGGAVVNWINNPGDANLAIVQSVSPVPALAGSPLTYTITVTNGGQAQATGVVLNTGLPAGATVVSPAGCSTTACALGDILQNQSVVVTATYTPAAPGALTTTASVTATSSDVVTSNNSHTTTANVVAAAAAVNLTLNKAASTAQPAPGEPFTYTLSVANAGPAAAANVQVVDAIPTTLDVTSVIASAGAACTLIGRQVVCTVPTLAAGAALTVTITASANAAGLIENTASVTSSSDELTPADNVATHQLMVTLAAACTTATFSGPFSFPATLGPVAMVRLVDMNHDGHLDAVAAHEADGGGVDVFLGNGAGQFAAPRFTALPTNPWVHIVADFNGDTHPDVISSSDRSSPTGPLPLRLLLNDGTGTLTHVQPFDIPFNGWMEAADLDGDGDQDLLTATEAGLALRRNGGAANFGAAETIYAGTVQGFGALADYNADGRIDVVVALGAAGYRVLLANAAGGFDASAVQPVPGGAIFAGQPADVNGDGRLDLILAGGDNDDDANGWTSLALGAGGGAFGPAVRIAADSFLLWQALADMNGDGRVDLVALSPHGVDVRLGDGSGAFSAPSRYANAVYYGPAVGDLNGDGRPDIAIGDRDGRLNVFFNNCGSAPTNLGLTISESADPVSEGDELTYTVTVTNPVAAEATGVRLRSVLSPEFADEMPEPNVEVLATTSSAGGTLAASGSTYTWTLPAVPAGGTATFQFRFRVLGGGTLNFSSGVTSDGAETDPSDNAALESTAVTAVGRTLVVSNTNDSGPGSLRQALTESNDAGDVDTIVFNIVGAGPRTIVPSRALPEITQPAVIDGTTQPGFTGTPLVELNGNGLNDNGLFITGGGTTVRGLAINRFGQNGILIVGASASVIEGNYIGLDLAGSAARPNRIGVAVLSSSGNRIGGTSAGSRNVISGNQLAGVSFENAGTTGNLVQGNFIGTNAAGTAGLGNGAGVVFTNGASTNTVGGTISGAGNVISGNGGDGISIQTGSTGNRVQGNRIGTNAAGTVAVSNSSAGVRVTAGSAVIGGTTAEARNVISGNTQGGVVLGSTSLESSVQGNYIGTNAAGTSPVANGQQGVLVNGTGNLTIGGTAAGAGNVISGNAVNGVLIVQSLGVRVQGNRIGTDAAGTIAIPNLNHGVSLAGSDGVVIGGTAAGAGNLISGNSNEGVFLGGGGGEITTIQGNLIGTNVSGTAALGNRRGVFVTSEDATIGGTTLAARNVISGNRSDGVFIEGVGADGAVVQGNYIGTDIDGTTAIRNQQNGVFVSSAPGSVIGGTVAGARNLISGNVSAGVRINNALGTVVQGNLVGTNNSAASAIPNSQGIVVNSAPSTEIADNVVSGNALQGIIVLGAGSTEVLILANRVGTNFDATGRLPNGSDGIRIDGSPGVQIGGPEATQGNVIAANGQHGVAIYGDAVGTLVQRNSVGIASSPVSLGNTLDGVQVTGGSNTSITGNAIEANGRNGVVVISGTANQVLGNGIVANDALGIDLGNDGPTANDSGDADAGANGLQNFPVLTSAVAAGGNLTVHGTLASTPNTTFRVEVFGGGADPSGFGEGAAFLGAVSVTTDGTGQAAFQTQLTGAVAAVSATATDPDGNTSEFGPHVAASVGAQTFTVTSANDSGAGTLRQAILDSNATAGTIDTIAFNIPGAGPHTITPVSALPTITGPVVIDGTTEPDFSGTPVIELDGTNAGPGTPGLNITGGNTTIRGLVINRFTSDGISINGGSGNVIRGNYIGLDRTGTAALPNGSFGISVFASQANLIGGSGPGEGNVVAAAASINISLQGGSHNNTVQGNRIGTNAAGTAAVGTNGNGVYLISSNNNLIGGTTPGARNVIAGSNGSGQIVIGNASTNNIVQGNYIGTNGAGTAALPNDTWGIQLGGPGNTIGGSDPGAGNVISGNAAGGIAFFGGADGNTVLGNLIGTAADGIAPVPNEAYGIGLEGPSLNSIGSVTGGGNVIAFNTGPGIAAPSGNRNQLRGNRIFSNGGLGIDLGTLGVTPNDAGDADTGANNLQNFPDLTGATQSGATISIQGTLDSTPNTTFTVAIFGAVPDPTGFGEGAEQLVALNVTTNAAGSASFDTEVSATGVTALTATATDPNGNTSEFSSTLQVTLFRPTVTLQAIDGSAAETGPDSAAFRFTRDGPITDPLLVHYTAGGNVSAGDYSPALTGIMTIPAGSASADLAIVAVDDPDVEGLESLVLDLVSAPGNPYDLGTPATATATIADNDTSTMSLALVGTTVVGVGRSATLRVTLSEPAPVGGIVVGVTSGSPGILTVASPGTVTFAPGQTSGDVTLNGVQAGTSRVTASAEGYPPAILDVAVTQNLISAPSTLNVPFGQTTALPISIGPSPAPAGGLTLDLVSSNPTVIEVVTPQVTVPAGSFSVNATVRGARIGQAQISVSTPSHAPAVTQATSSAELNIVQATASFNDGLPPPSLTVRLESAGTPVAAQPAQTVQLTSANPACVTAPASITILNGQVSATFAPAYGGTASLPCTASITAAASDLVSDSVSVTVNPQAQITAPGEVVVAGGLMTPVVASLETSQHGGVSVTVSSTNAAALGVSPNASTVAAQSFTVTVPHNQSQLAYYVHGTGNEGTATISISAPAFGPASHQAHAVRAGVELHGLPATTTTLSGESRNVYVQVGIPAATGTHLLQTQQVRAGVPMVITLTNSDDAVGALRSDEPAGTGQSVTKPIAPGNQYSLAVPGDFSTNWGLAFIPRGNGTTTVTASGPEGVLTMTSTGVRQVQVEGASITAPGAAFVGAGLMTSTAATLSAGEHNGVEVTVSSNDPSRVRVGFGFNEVGAASVSTTFGNGSTSVPYYIHGISTTDPDEPVIVTISAPGFGSTSHPVHVRPIAVELWSVDTTYSLLGGEDADLYAAVGIPDAGGNFVQTWQPVRAGETITVTLSNANPAVAEVRSDEPEGIGQTGQSVTKSIQAGSAYTLPLDTSTAWGLAFRPRASGNTALTVTVPGGQPVATGVRAIQIQEGATITPPPTTTVGSGLMTTATATLSAAQHGGVEFTVTSTDPSRVRVSFDPTLVGGTTATTTIPNGQSFVVYYVHGIAAGPATLTLSADGFTATSHDAQAVPAGVEIWGLDAVTSNLSAPNTSWYVQVGLPNTDGTALQLVQAVRPDAPLVVTLTNSNPNVARLGSDDPFAVGQTVTKTIQPGQYFTQPVAPGTSWGLTFEPLANGFTTVSVAGPPGTQTMSTTGVRAVEVGTPGFVVENTIPVGAGLQHGVFVTLQGSQHGGIDVTVTSSDPSLVRVSRDGMTAGVTSIDVPVGNGSGQMVFYLQGMEGMSGTATVTLSAPGFNSKIISVPVVPPVLEIHGLPASIALGAPEEVNWYAVVGLPDATGSYIAALQTVRAGSPGFGVTITASPAIATLRSDEPPSSGQTVVKPIAPHAYFTQSISAGTTFGLGFTPTAAGTVTVTVTGPPGSGSTPQATRTIQIQP